MIAEATVFGQISPCVTTVGLCLEDHQYKCPLYYSVSPAGQINTDQLQEGEKLNKSPFLIGQKHPCDSSNNAWKDANHNNGAIEPQLSLCYEDFKDRHLFLPDIHNKGINEKEKCKDSTKKRKNKTTWRKSGHFFLYCMFLSFFTKWSLIVNLLFFNPNLGIYGGIFSICLPIKNGCLWLIIIGNEACRINRFADVILSPMWL